MVWFVCISSGNSQASEELAGHNCEGDPLPCGPFLPGLYKVGEESQGDPSLTKAQFSSPVKLQFSSGQRGLQSPFPTAQCLLVHKWDQPHSEREWQQGEKCEAKCHHFFSPLVMVRGPAPDPESSDMRAQRAGFPCLRSWRCWVLQKEFLK